MKVKFSKNFSKQRDKSPQRIQKALHERIKLFLKDPSHSLLNFHKLSGKLKNYYSINITGNWRAILFLEKDRKIVEFLFLGTHSELYR